VTRVFVDTSAVLAFTVPDDAAHRRARLAFENLAARQAALVTTSYVLVETYALLGRRLGIEAVASFRAHFAPLLDVHWVDAALHEEGLDLLLQRRVRDLSLVDAVSFLAIRRQRLDEVWAYDRHFEAEDLPLVE
jgi:uncharacterized protein